MQRFQISFEHRKTVNLPDRATPTDAQATGEYIPASLRIINRFEMVLERHHMYTPETTLRGILRYFDQNVLAYLFGAQKIHYWSRTRQTAGGVYINMGPEWYGFLDFFREKTGKKLHHEADQSALTESDQELAQLVADLSDEYFTWLESLEPNDLHPFDPHSRRHTIAVFEGDINTLVLKHPYSFTLTGSFPEAFAFLEGINSDRDDENIPHWVKRWWAFERGLKVKPRTFDGIRDFAVHLYQTLGDQGALAELLHLYQTFEPTDWEGNPFSP
ncbi:hypothetical protein [Deinococcus cellulosilyticus]|uniref:Uncharacterized protein n=1 Tax=Deinococcus cellulosilyticus (strain DSM 18568 / NBRC 106333 / KACC 11606 / 5516J-15) TaxID=1223518 RepID=A0A511MXY0_DEIC1|nr:hypothetical protein [Deinococcus cellulosilyticus]GEM45465.1 hypothetical protein DC3_11000 [Deinococcus cellulosilyticus NBRC 106333 = KACC 11606]